MSSVALVRRERTPLLWAGAAFVMLNETHTRDETRQMGSAVAVQKVCKTSSATTYLKSFQSWPSCRPPFPARCRACHWRRGNVYALPGCI